MKLQHGVAVLTGAGGGIGRALALGLARHGCHLALAEVRASDLAETASACRMHGVQVSEHVLDVADREALLALPAAVLAAHGQVDLLINNAGVALGGSFEQVSEADFDWLFAINFQAVVRLTRLFLPLLRTRQQARIVYLSSVYGLVSPPGQTAYSASKFAVRGFANALRHELAGSPVGVTVVHPGGVATAIARHARVPTGANAAEVAQRLARAEKTLRMTPERAAEIILRGVMDDRARVLVGGDAKFIALLERLAPVRYWGLLSRLIGRS